MHLRKCALRTSCASHLTRRLAAMTDTVQMGRDCAAWGFGSSALISSPSTFNSLVADDAGTSAFIFSEDLVDILDGIDRPKWIHWPTG